MGKRSSFERNPRDYYRTWDRRAVAALLPHLMPGTRFVEPCAGRGDLVDQLVAAGHTCVDAFDIEPQRQDIGHGDALKIKAAGNFIWITNPPWRRDILHPMIESLADQAPLWILLDADWVHTKQAIPFLPRLRAIVSVGRLRWEEDTTMDGKDNCVWLLLSTPASVTSPAQFYGRTPAKVSR